MQTFYLRLADLILITHATLVLFLVAGFALIWIGYFCRWQFVRNFYFRLTHLLVMACITVQTILGQSCPLTIWENELRIKGGTGPAYSGSFIEYWVGKFLFYEFRLGIFIVLYTTFFAAVLASFFVVKPRWPGKQKPPFKSRAR